MERSERSRPGRNGVSRQPPLHEVAAAEGADNPLDHEKSAAFGKARIVTPVICRKTLCSNSGQAWAIRQAASKSESLTGLQIA